MDWETMEDFDDAGGQERVQGWLNGLPADPRGFFDPNV